ncbi:MAG: hypothetical protein DRN96_07390 [Thermoproteota archaeon]|nr:MAG: hypothetical protein DRN96_07390 [Candidatus Korarchaeota archaeon]
MSHSIAVADTCFILDWASFSLRDLMRKVFSAVFLLEDVLAEVRSSPAVEWVADNLASGYFTLFTPSPDKRREAEQLVELVATRPHMRRIEIPEALCLTLGKQKGYIVLTENTGALMVADMIQEYSAVKVWRALELLKEIAARKLAAIQTRSQLLHLFQRYEHETKHKFPRRDLEEAIREVIEKWRGS